MKSQKGVTLIELMIVIAIVAIIGAIAIPAYNGYVREAKFSTAMHNIETVRVFLEDWSLDNGDYRTDTTNATQTLFWFPGDNTKQTTDDDLGWTPDGDKGLYNYTLSLQASTYDILIEEISDSTVWVRCENRFTSCCDYDSDSDKSSAACN